MDDLGIVHGVVRIVFEIWELGALDWHCFALAMSEKGYGPFTSIIIVGFVKNSNVGSKFSTSCRSLSQVLKSGCSLGEFANDGIDIFWGPGLSFYRGGIFSYVRVWFDPGFYFQWWATFSILEREFKVVVLLSSLPLSIGQVNLVDFDITSNHVANEREEIISMELSFNSGVVGGLSKTEIGECCKWGNQKFCLHFKIIIKKLISLAALKSAELAIKLSFHRKCVRLLKFIRDLIIINYKAYKFSSYTVDPKSCNLAQNLINKPRRSHPKYLFEERSSPV